MKRDNKNGHFMYVQQQRGSLWLAECYPNLIFLYILSGMNKKSLNIFKIGYGSGVVEK